MLKTPTAQLAINGGSQHPDKRKAGGHGPTLADEVEHLLPTPTSTDAKSSSGSNPAWGHGTTLTDAARAVATRDWGRYAPAVERWERILERQAPDPTEPAPRGGRRLAPVFPEWMMGLPPGYVTAVPGLTRNQQLRAIGDGVCPQQGVHALRALKERFE